MQAFIHARLVQLIVGLGEVVQAYIDITGFEQPPYGHQENLQTLFGGREVFGLGQALCLETRGQMGVVVQGNEIGRASCRERVCQYVEIWVVAVTLKKKKTK